MAQTLTELLGDNATLTSGTLTVKLADLKDANGNAYLDAPTASSASQAVAALLAHLHRVTKPATNPDGTDVVDKTDAIVSTQSFSPKTFEVRDDEAQVKYELNFSVYTADTASFDPDNVV